MSRSLIIGFGNPLREDDGLGWQAALTLAPRLSGSSTSVVLCHQLAPELAESVARADRVLFIDASAEGPPGEVRIAEVRPAAGETGGFSHELDASALMKCAHILYGRIPPAWICTVSGERFGFGQDLSPKVAAALDRLCGEVARAFASEQEPIGSLAVKHFETNTSPGGYLHEQCSRRDRAAQLETRAGARPGTGHALDPFSHNHPEFEPGS